jgi:hypothetical protein
LSSESPENDLFKLMNNEDPMRDDEDIYDFENVLENKPIIPNSKERQVIPELLEDVERIRDLMGKVSKDEVL